MIGGTFHRCRSLRSCQTKSIVAATGVRVAFGVSRVHTENDADWIVANSMDTCFVSARTRAARTIRTPVVRSTPSPGRFFV